MHCRPSLLQVQQQLSMGNMSSSSSRKSRRSRSSSNQKQAERPDLSPRSGVQLRVLCLQTAPCLHRQHCQPPPFNMSLRGVLISPKAVFSLACACFNESVTRVSPTCVQQQLSASRLACLQRVKCFFTCAPCHLRAMLMFCVVFACLHSCLSGKELRDPRSCVVMVTGPLWCLESVLLCCACLSVWCWCCLL